MFIQSDGQDSGYYFEVLLSEYAYLDQQVKREVRVWKFDESGNREILVGYYPADLTSFSEEELLQITGADTVIIPEKSYKLTISRTDLGFLFIVNGKNVLWLEDETIKNGKWGVFTRANTVAEFEYVYAIDRGSDSTALSEAQIAIRDQLTGGYNDNTLDYFLSQNSGIVQDFRFDDFGSWVRAAKELDVVHDIFPSITSRLFVANSTSVYTIYNNHTQFSSEFAIANRKREYAVVSGDDQNINASMVLAVYGVPIKQDEPSDVKRLNERSIWRRGEEEIIVDSTFIQSEEHAERISDWIVERWSSPIKIVAVESIVDPRIQLGDVASIDFSDLNFSPEANRFHVIDVSTSVGASMSMSVTLRKIS
jgi:hypothetical protein